MAESHGDAKGTTAHTEAEGGHKAPFPPFQKDTFASQLVSLLIAFVALYLIVSRIALPRVGSVIDERQNRIEGDLADAQKLKDQSDGALKVFAGFVAMLGFSLGALGWAGGVLPLALTVALTALELLVAFLPAYVVTILTCIYLNDALHAGH